MTKESVSFGKMLGAILLVTGCCIGAGMLGLPVLTGLAGFQPSMLMFILSWAFMTITGLLLLEVNLSFSEDVSIISMLGATLGIGGRILGWGLFTFLFYSLMVAYVAGSGQLFSDFAQQLFHVAMPEWIGALLISLLFGFFLYLGTHSVDLFNRWLMLGLILAYVVLVFMGLSHVNATFLQHSNWSAATYALPAMIISFGYHNLIPTLTNYLNRDVKKLRITIILGSAIPLVVYLLWEWIVLGLIPVEGAGGFREALDQGDMATRALKNAVGSSWIVNVAHYFAFFAMVTSFLTVALSFVDFLSDGLQVKKNPQGKLLLCFLSLTPPLLFALIYPNMFLTALGYAGAFGAVILFGILPAAMAWSTRYVKKMGGQRLVPGGKSTLIAVIFLSFVVIVLQLIQTLWRAE